MRNVCERRKFVHEFGFALNTVTQTQNFIAHDVSSLKCNSTGQANIRLTLLVE